MHWPKFNLKPVFLILSFTSCRCRSWVEQKKKKPLIHHLEFLLHLNSSHRFDQHFSAKNLGIFLNQRTFWGIYTYPCVCWMLSQLMILWWVEHSSNPVQHPAWRTVWLHKIWEWCHLLLAQSSVFSWWPCWDNWGQGICKICHQASF